ncbi:rod shape-determining protein MreD [Hydrogenivirga caldilitoris]|uniref:Rod shape-determining protein MreD n=1 Tax=Hydrogenivirga caldilitoris TaxID=246264 RepID=A0A497XVA3_9AQUI|nr:rod shape-determining protein MreD [Hydrogenivirga caldilitoris]RLJ71082.1 rod shape-determining protein MreD [Hydrogenivirga caldilitoris]
MRYTALFLVLLFFEAAVLQTLFKPGFIAPDLVLIALISRAYLLGRSTVLWAVFGGTVLDLMTDTVGLHMSLETLSVYIFLLIHERLLFRTVLTYIVPGTGVLLLKKSLAFLIMRSKFSFELSPEAFFLSWLFEVGLLFSIYYLYIRRYEQA